MGDQFTNSDFKVCFRDLKTEDLEEYIKLAQKELQGRREELFVKASEELVNTINKFLEDFPEAKIYINDDDSVVWSSLTKGPVTYEAYGEEPRLEIFTN